MSPRKQKKEMPEKKGAVMITKDNTLTTSSKDNTMAKKLFMTAAVVLVALLIQKYVLPHKVGETSSLSATPTEVPKETLPAGWVKKNINQNGYLVRFEKKSKNDIQPTVVVVTANLPENKDPKTYISELIKGTQSTLTSYHITEETVNDTNGTYVKSINATYTANGQKIALKERLIIKGKQAYVITASFDTSEESKLNNELLTIFNIVFNEYIH